MDDKNVELNYFRSFSCIWMDFLHGQTKHNNTLLEKNNKQTDKTRYFFTRKPSGGIASGGQPATIESRFRKFKKFKFRAQGK